MTDDYDPYESARQHYRQALWLRDTLESVARELERMAAGGQADTRLLLRRTRQVRQRLHQGVPNGWTAGRAARSRVSQEPSRALQRR